MTLNTAAWRRGPNNGKQSGGAPPASLSLSAPGGTPAATLTGDISCQRSYRWPERWWFKRLRERRRGVWKSRPAMSAPRFRPGVTFKHAILLTEGLMALINTHRDYDPAVNKPPFFTPFRRGRGRAARRFFFCVCVFSDGCHLDSVILRNYWRGSNWAGPVWRHEMKTRSAAKLHLRQRCEAVMSSPRTPVQKQWPRWVQLPVQPNSRTTKDPSHPWAHGPQR